MPVADWSNLASAQCLQTRFQSADGALLLTKLTAAPWLDLILESSDEDDDVLDNLLVQAVAAVAEGGEPRFVNEE